MKRFLIVISLLISCAVPLIAGDVNLAWDASVSAGVTNYRVYVGPASGTFNQSFTIGNILTYRVVNLTPGTYYFAVTAIDAQANESAFSNIVSTTVGGPPAAPGNFRLPPVVISGTNPPPKVVVTP
jgi:fibronectin type 3 domain-containing protein